MLRLLECYQLGLRFRLLTSVAFLDCCKRELAFEPIQFRLVETLSRFVYSQRFGQHAQPFFDLSRFSIRFGQQGKRIRPRYFCSCGPQA